MNLGHISCRDGKRPRGQNSVRAAEKTAKLSFPGGSGSLWDPQLVREGGCHIVRCHLYGAEFPSCFLSDFLGDTETGLEWQSDSCPFYSESSLEPRLGIRRKDRLTWGAVEGCDFSVPRKGFDASRGADSTAGSGAALVFYSSGPFPGERFVNTPGCEC